MAILETSHVSKQFPIASGLFEKMGCLLGRSIRQRAVYAVNDVSLSVRGGEIMGLVGESGCGKSTLSRIISGIYPPASGNVFFKGKPVPVSRDGKNKRQAAGIQMIFQNCRASLNVRRRVVDIIAEGPLYHGLAAKHEVDGYVCEKMAQAGIDPAFRFGYPHQFSGGQCQRIGIARALAMQPDLMVCDEVMAALDVSIQAQVINLFLALKEKFSLTYLFVSHDLGVIRHLSDRVSVMYLGRIVEQARVDDIFTRPNHPYSKALLDNMLSLGDRRRRFITVKGELSLPPGLPSGCGFYPRCLFAVQKCRTVTPLLTEVAAGHFSACHLNDQL